MSDDKNEQKKFNSDKLVIQNIMNNQDGRDYMWKCLINMGIYENTFDKDPIKHAYNAGKRQAGLQLEEDLKQYAASQYVKMIQENNNG